MALYPSSNNRSAPTRQEAGSSQRKLVFTSSLLAPSTPLEAGEASAAPTVIEHHPEVNLLLTDVGLPGLNGRRLAEEASRRLPGRVSAPRRHPAPKVAQVVERAN